MYVIRRSICSGSVDGTCVMLNEASAVLERDVCSALRRWLRVPPGELLPLGAPPAAGGPQAHPDVLPAMALRLNRELDAQRLLYLVRLFVLGYLVGCLLFRCGFLRIRGD